MAFENGTIYTEGVSEQDAEIILTYEEKYKQVAGENCIMRSFIIFTLQ
jgi:hypothetical protein